MATSNRYLHIFVFFVFTRLVAIIFSTPCLSDIPLYFFYFSNLDSGLEPYSQFKLEYPPLSLIPIYFSGIFYPQNLVEYIVVFMTIFFAFDYLCLEICRFYCRKRLKMDEEEIAYMTFLYTIFGLMLFRIIYHHLDLIVAIFFALSLALFNAQKNSKFAISLNAFLGFFYKIVPAINLPAAFIIKDQKPVKIATNSIIFLLTLIGGIWFLEFVTKQNFITNMLFHQKRGIHLESIFGTISLIKDFLTGKTSIIYQQYGSFDIKASEGLTIFSKFFGHFVLLIFYAGLFFKFRHRKKIHEEDFLNATLISIMIFLSFQRVLSPQFFIWLTPIISIWLAKNRSKKFLLIFLFIFLCTWAIFSIDYSALLNQEPILITILCLRNLTLPILTIILAKNFFINERKNSDLH